MPAYTPPATNAVNFALGTFTPADNTPNDSPLAAVVPPALDAADFALVAYTQPADNGTEFDLSAAFAPDAGDSGGATQTLAKRAPDSATESESAEEVQSRGLRVIDTTGRLPRNPADWPEELKQAVAECCCGGSSSSDNSSSGSSSSDTSSFDSDTCCEDPWDETGCPPSLTAILTVNCASFGTISCPMPLVSCFDRQWSGNSGIFVNGVCTVCPGAGAGSPFGFFTWSAGIECQIRDGVRKFIFSFNRTNFASYVGPRGDGIEMTLLSCSPFLAIASGIIECGINGPGEVTSPCSNCVGADWSVTVSE